MNQSSLMSGDDAAQKAGISATTLQRFIDAGCLTVVDERNGIPYFAVEEVAALFGFVPSVVTEHDEWDLESGPLDDGVPTTSSDKAEDEISEENDDEEEFFSNRSEELHDQAYPSHEYEENEGSTEELLGDTITSSDEPADRRVQELMKVISFQDTLLSDREEEIRDLRAQRAWLKTRIERLEERGEQERILLLSETATIKQLIELQTKQRLKSPWRSLLEFLGITERTVEMAEEGRVFDHHGPLLTDSSSHTEETAESHDATWRDRKGEQRRRKERKDSSVKTRRAANS